MATKINGTRIRLILIATASFLAAGAAHHASGAVPSVPASVTATAPLEGQTALSWTASSGGATSYSIYRSTSAGSEILLQSNVPGNTFEDSNLNNGQTYYYKVTAVNGSGESGKSSEVSALTKAAASSGMSSVVGDSKVVVSWPAAPTATSYEIYRDTLGGVGGAAYFLVTGTSFTDTGLINGTSYFYQMSSINPSGETASQTPPTFGIPTAGGNSAPAAPANVVATAGNAKVVLTWAPANNASSYQIFRGISSSQVTTSITTVSALSYTDGGLTNGATYYYIVKAVNTTGQTPSAVANATPYVPSAPTLTATGGVGQIVVTWPATSSSSYAIYRGIAPGAETLLDQGLTGNTYTDAGMTNGGTYYYRVALANAGGTGPLSNEVSASATAMAPVAWSGTISFGLPGEPVQSCPAYFPDTSRPVQGALVITFMNAGTPNLQALADKYNLLLMIPQSYNFGTPTSPINLTTNADTEHQVQVMDWRWPLLSGLRLQAMLTSAAAMFPTHPEIQYTGVVLYGFSEGAAHANLAVSPSYNLQTGTITPSAFSNRILAVMQLSELDEASSAPVMTMDTIPHLFLTAGLSNGGSFDGSALNVQLGDYPFTSVTVDGLARGLATNQGAPLTTIVDVAGGHGANEDYLFVSLWLDSILSQRLPATIPTSAPVNLPSWQNNSSWVGTYDVSTTTASPWGSSVNPGLQMTNNLVSPKSAYSDPRPYTWLPSQNIAATWLAFANSGSVTAFSPVITSPTTATGTVGSAFSYQITATNEPTSFAATNLPVWLSLNTTTGVITSILGVALVPGTYTIQLSAANSQGTGANATLTLTFSGLLTYSQWAAALNFNGAPSGFSRNDGVSNLIKYLCDINPTIPMNAASRAALPAQGMTTINGITYLTLTYRQNPSIDIGPGINGIIIQPQTSSDLKTWQPTPQSGVEIPPDLVQQVGTDLTTPNHDPIMEVGFKVTGTTNRYIRLNVTQ